MRASCPGEASLSQPGLSASPPVGLLVAPVTLCCFRRGQTEQKERARLWGRALGSGTRDGSPIPAPTADVQTRGEGVRRGPDVAEWPDREQDTVPLNAAPLCAPLGPRTSSDLDG